MDYTLMAPHGAGWLKVSKCALGSGLWMKTSETGVIITDDEIPNLVAELQHYMSLRAKERAKAARQ